MIEYPIRVDRHTYGGQDPRKRETAFNYNQDAALLEKHINDQIKSGKRGVFSYSTIAQETGFERDIVASILFCVAGGHNGFTIPEDIKVE